MVMCFVPQCRHYSEKKTCRFFRFPKETHIRNKWISLIRRLDRDPSQNSMVCSCHFKNSEKSNLPTIFEWNKNKIFTSVSPEPKRKTSTKQTSPKIHASAASELRNPESGRSDSCASSSLLQNFDKLQIPGNIEQEAEMYFLKKENEELKKKQHCQNAFSYEHIKSNDKLINMYTGIPNSYLFETLYSIFENMHLKYAMGWSVTNIPRVDQLLLTLMKLRLNLLHLDLAHRFNCSSTTVTNVVITWVCALHEILFCQLMKEIPSRHKNRTCMPSAFSAFSNCRIILDCTEVKYVKPKQMYKQKVTYSHYEHQNTLKGLIGVAPNGVITFMSELYPGSTSDKNIVKDSGILEKFHCGDLIVADKDFLIKDILPPGVHLNIPPFLTSAQFTPEQIIQTRSIAKARIHVERAIRRIKCYSIINSIPATCISYANKIFQVCGALTNYQFPLIAEVADLYNIENE